MLPPPDPTERAALVERWLDLTRRQLPAASAEHRWPIRRDHCFMRVCLDAAFARPWFLAVRAPAIRFAADADLTRAVLVGENLLQNPARLPGLNAWSIAERRRRGSGSYSA